MKRICKRCGSKYHKEFDLIGATGRRCRICDFWWDDVENLDASKGVGE